MELKNTRFGDIVYQEKDLLEITGGLVGFPDLTEFLILDFEAATPFKWLQSVSEPAMGFLIAEPRLFRPEYSLSLDKEDLAAFDTQSVGDLVIFVICTYREGMEKTTGNLLAPVVVSDHSRRGRQVILEGSVFTTSESVFTQSRGADAPDQQSKIEKHFG